MTQTATATLDNKWYWLVLLLILGALIYLLSPVLTPFFIAALLAYLGDPIVDRLETLKVPRVVAVTMVFVVIFIVLIVVPIIILPILEQQLLALIRKIPKYVQWFQENVNSRFGQFISLDTLGLGKDQLQTTMAQYWKQIGGVAGNFFKTVTQSGLALIALLANMVLIPVVTFYLLRDWDTLMAKFHNLLPRQYEANITTVARESDDVLAAFLRGQLTVMFALGIVYSIGLSMTGLDLAILIGLVAGIVSFVPYLGFIVGITFASVATYFQFQDVMALLPVFAVFIVGQLLEGLFLTPKLVGDKIGLHPVAVIFSVMAGGQLFGFIGVLLALPVAAVIVVILRHMLSEYTDSSLYSRLS
ncbi:MAG: AI-2E family transporter [Thiohalomonadales bacterium]